MVVVAQQILPRVAEIVRRIDASMAYESALRESEYALRKIAACDYRLGLYSLEGMAYSTGIVMAKAHRGLLDGVIQPEEHAELGKAMATLRADTLIMFERDLRKCIGAGGEGHHEHRRGHWSGAPGLSLSSSRVEAI